MRFIRSLVNFYIYSSVHIALGAALSVILCYAVSYHIPTSNYALFVFSSTLFLYCSHKIVGIRKMKSFEDEGRFAVIKKFKSHLILYALLGGLATLYFFTTLEPRLQIALILPSVISVLYILPVFSNNKRLRDFDLIKIFLISIIWGLIIGLIPYFEVNGFVDFTGFLYFMEKLTFILAITIPFDIRDLRFDKKINVITIPGKLGVKKSYLLTYILLGASLIICTILYYLDYYSLKVMLALITGYMLTAVAVLVSKNKRDDYYYSGLLDGTIIIVALMGIVASGILAVVF